MRDGLWSLSSVLKSGHCGGLTVTGGSAFHPQGYSWVGLRVEVGSPGNLGFEALSETLSWGGGVSI